MNRVEVRITLFIGIAVVAGGAGTEARAQYARRSPIVQAVQKTRAGVVAIIIPKNRYQRRESIGTGIIIDERGYIITNRHVVGSKNTVTVQFQNGKKHTGRIIQTFASYDLVVLRVDTKKKLKALTLAPVRDLMVGETVIAVGHPFGFRNTVSVGIISALNRRITMPTGEVLDGLIQTDAGINPGSSGGPLLNINGELIGVTAALRDGAQNIAFAINAGTVKRLLKKHCSALKFADVGHGMECTDKIVAETGDRQRAEVAVVHRQTPAARAGLRQGDVILAVGSLRVNNAFDIERGLWGFRAGQKVRLKVQRQDKILTVVLTLAAGKQMKQTAHSVDARKSKILLRNVDRSSKIVAGNASVKEDARPTLSSPLGDATQRNETSQLLAAPLFAFVTDNQRGNRRRRTARTAAYHTAKD